MDVGSIAASNKKNDSRIKKSRLKLTRNNNKSIVYRETLPTKVWDHDTSSKISTSERKLLPESSGQNIGTDPKESRLKLTRNNNNSLVYRETLPTKVWNHDTSSKISTSERKLLPESSGQNIDTDPKESNKESSEMDQETQEFDIAMMNNGQEYVDVPLMSQKEFDELFSQSPVSISSSLFDENVGNDGGSEDIGGSDETIDYINQ